MVSVGIIFLIISEMFHGRIFLKSVLLLLLVNFVSVQVGIDVYIPHCKYQVKPRLSPWFSAAFAVAMVDRNLFFFHLYEQNKSSQSTVKFKHVSTCCKRVLEAAKLAHANKTKQFLTSQKLVYLVLW